MGRRCRHPIDRRITRHIKFTAGMSFRSDVNVCGACFEWLSLGPARDDGEHVERVAIEVRAAEIVASGHQFDHGRMRSMHWYEGCGWDNAKPDDESLSHTLCGDPADEPEDGPMHLAGHLARCITLHNEAEESLLRHILGDAP